LKKISIKRTVLRSAVLSFLRDFRQKAEVETYCNLTPVLQSQLNVPTKMAPGNLFEHFSTRTGN